MARLLVEPAGRVAIDDRTAEGDVLGGVTVAAHGNVPPAEHEFEPGAARRAEDRHALLAEALFVVFHLPIEPRDPIRLDQPQEDFANQPLLVGRIEFALDHRLGDVPVGRDPRPQQAPLGVAVVPGEADLLPLRRRERVVEQFDQRLGRRLFGPLGRRDNSAWADAGQRVAAAAVLRKPRRDNVLKLLSHWTRAMDFSIDWVPRVFGGMLQSYTFAAFKATRKRSPIATVYCKAATRTAGNSRASQLMLVRGVGRSFGACSTPHRSPPIKILSDRRAAAAQGVETRGSSGGVLPVKLFAVPAEMVPLLRPWGRGAFNDTGKRARGSLSKRPP